MNALAVTYQHIADILSFETSDVHLKDTLSHPLFDWDLIVVEGSRHLVLPAIYCRLKSKQLLHLLPVELTHYLLELTILNRERNDAILQQIRSIATLFNKNEINHTFLKGAALLISNCYDDNAERMIGDIDILIATTQIDIAFDLLKKQDYNPITLTLGGDFFEHKHLPRMTTKQHICAVELHKTLFTSYEYAELKNEAILDKTIKLHHLYIPSNTHLLMHNVLNFQINDNGALYNSISFRSAYDTISLLQHSQQNKAWITDNKHFKNYFNRLGLFFDDVQLNIKTQTNIATNFYLFKLNHITFYKLWNKLIDSYSLIKLLFQRLLFFITNPSYRKAIKKDKRRIKKHLTAKIKNI